MQKYKCHKVVEAMKIGLIEIWLDGSATLNNLDDETRGVSVKQEWMAKHHPQPGGYYVNYKDGYSSYSPAEAFEAGYETIEEAEDKAKGESSMAALASGLLALLDRIEIEDDTSLASQRHEMAEAVGLTVVFDHETSAALQ